MEQSENKEIKDVLIPEGYCEKLVVKSNDDESLIQLSKNFLDVLEEQTKQFIDKNIQEEKLYEKYKNNSNYIFYPEKVSKKSPLTIINAPWGSGKTYFIEQIFKNLIDKKIENNYFENVILIDAWKYSTINNIPDELIHEIFNNLSKIYSESKDDFLVTMKYLFNLSSSWISNFLEDKFSLPIGDKSRNKNEKKELELQEKFKKSLKNINQKIKPTIIFIDNIERIGENGWEIMKALYKLSTFKNLVIVLSMNMKMFIHSTSQNKDINEYSIEKFVDIAYFDLIQDYKSLFHGLNIEDLEELELLDSIFNQEIEGKKLSIREIEQRFNKHNILNIENKYEKAFKIVDKIWGSKTILKKYVDEKCENYYQIKEDIYNELINFINEIKKNINNNLTSLKQFDNENNYVSLNLFNETKEYLNKDLIDEDEHWYLFDDINDLEYFEQFFKNLILFFKNELKNNQNELNKNNQKIKKNNTSIERYKKYFEEHNEDLIKLQEKKDNLEVVDNLQIENLKKSIQEDENQINILKNNILDIEKSVSYIKENITFLQTEIDFYNHNQQNLKEFIKNYKKN